MYADGDITWFLRSADRTGLWPIDVYTSRTASRGKLPEGSVSVVAPRTAWWVDASDLLANTGGPGNSFMLECYLRSYAQPWQMGRVQTASVTYDAQTDEVELQAEAIWAWLTRARLLMENAAADVTVAYTNDTTDIARQIARDNMITPGNVPTDYPAGSDRGDFGGLTVAVEADTAAGDTITFTCDQGKNIQEVLRDLAHRWDLAYEWSISGATLTLSVKTPWSSIGTDLTFGTTGDVFSPELGTLVGLKDDADYTPVRNTWVLKDGTNRSWTNDAGSIALYGTMEDTKKAQSGGGAMNVTELGYEAALQLLDKDPVRKIELRTAEGQSFWVAGTDYNIGSQVSVACSPWGVYTDWYIAAMDISQGAGEVPVVKVAINSERRSYAGEAWRKPGPPGYGAGSRWTSLHG